MKTEAEQGELAQTREHQDCRQPPVDGRQERENVSRRSSRRNQTVGTLMSAWGH